MSNSLFLKFIARVMLPILIMLSIFLLLRGHNQPGGGFIGGLVGAGGIVLLTLAYGADAVRTNLRIDFLRLMLWGVALAAASAIISLVLGGNLLKAIWIKPYIQGIGALELGTPVLFDIGVYLAVVGTVSSMVMNLAEEGERDEEE